MVKWRHIRCRFYRLLVEAMFTCSDGTIFVRRYNYIFREYVSLSISTYVLEWLYLISTYENTNYLIKKNLHLCIQKDYQIGT